MRWKAAEPAESFMSRLNPLTKVAAALVLTAAALACRSPASMACLLACVAVSAGLGRVSWRGAWLVWFCLPVAVVASGNYLITGDPSEAARQGMRIAVLMAGVPICALTTRPAGLVRSLTRVRIPVGILIAVMLVWKFFPVILAQSREVRDAQQLRGALRGPWLYRGFRSRLMPLVFSSVDYADRVGLALELRGFDPAHRRTWYNVPRFGWRDGLYGLMLIAFLSAAFSIPVVS